MAFYHGIKTREQATSISTPVVADVGIPFVVGTAPLHAAENPADVNYPVLCTSWDEAVSKLGYSEDYKKYTLCEFMFSHFQLYQCQPVVFCNVLDVNKGKKDLEGKEYSVEDHAAKLPFDVTDLVVRKSGGYIEGTVMDARTIAPAPANEEQHDLKNGDMIADDIRIMADGTVTGTIKYVTGYTGFDSVHKELQSGYYFPVHLGDAYKGKSVTVQSIGKDKGQPKSGSDQDWVIRLSDKADRVLKITAEGVPEVQLNFKQCRFLEPDEALDLEKDVDYTISYDATDDACYIELLSSGTAFDEEKLYVSGKTVNTEIDENDIITGIGVIDMCMSTIGTIPDLICAPGYSHISTVAAVMAAKAGAGINGLFTAKACIDIDCGPSGARAYDEVLAQKNKNNLVDADQIACWPMVKLGDRKFHMSTQIAGLMAQVDTGNNGVPYESPSNKNYQMDGLCLEDGTEVLMTFEQANNLNSNGIVTALNFMSSGWVCWGNCTACYPSNTDVKDYFISISRMFTFVASTLIRTFWSKIDKPMNKLLLDNIQNSTQIWLDGLVGSSYLLGARVEILANENPLTNLMAGIITVHIYITPPSPMQELDFVLEYDPSYAEELLK